MNAIRTIREDSAGFSRLCFYFYYNAFSHAPNGGSFERRLSLHMGATLSANLFLVLLVDNPAREWVGLFFEKSTSITLHTYFPKHFSYFDTFSLSVREDRQVFVRKFLIYKYI